jgi:hypothetical protein
MFLKLLFTGNIQKTVSDTNIEIRPLYLIEGISLKIISSTCQLNQGFCIFHKFLVFATPEKTFDLEFILNEKTIVVKKIVKIKLQKCEKGEILIKDDICSRCKDNFFSLATNFSNATTCFKCPEFTDCPGGSIMIPYMGYWRQNENTSIIMKCKYLSACPY